MIDRHRKRRNKSFLFYPAQKMGYHEKGLGKDEEGMTSANRFWLGQDILYKGPTFVCDVHHQVQDRKIWSNIMLVKLLASGRWPYKYLFFQILLVHHQYRNEALVKSLERANPFL